MQVEFAFLADAAQMTGGKLYVLGGAFDRISGKEVPVVHPHMTLVMRVVLSPEEAQQPHQLEVRLLDGDGKKISSSIGHLSVTKSPKSPEMLKSPSAVITLNFVNTKFERFGDYAIEIFGDGSHLKGLPLCVAQRPGSSATA